MTGPEHYRQAQGHLMRAEIADDGSHMELYSLFAAVGHGLLANAAATALSACGMYGMNETDSKEWLTACGATPTITPADDRVVHYLNGDLDLACGFDGRAHSSSLISQVNCADCRKAVGL